MFHLRHAAHPHYHVVFAGIWIRWISVINILYFLFNHAQPMFFPTPVDVFLTIEPLNRCPPFQRAELAVKKR